MTRSLFSLKPPGLPPPRPPGAPPPPAMQDEPASEDVSERVLSKLRGASQALPTGVAPTSVRAIRPGQLVRVLTEALAPEKRRFEEELARARQRTRELEGELDRVREERKDVDETRRVELPRLAALVDQERTRVEALERERDSFTQRIRELEADVARRETQAIELQAAMAPVEEVDAVGDTLAAVKERLDSLAAAKPTTSPPPSAEAAASAPVASDGSGTLVEALLSSDARALRIAALEQRLADLTGHATTLPGAEEPPAARAVAALMRASQEESRARADRLETKVDELLGVVRALHGALGEEARRRALVEGALRAAQARLALVERRAPTPSFSAIVRDGVRGDVGPLLDALRDEARQREDALDARVQRLSVATRAALERMAEILDQALVAGLFDRDVPRLDKDEVCAPITEAVSDGPPSRPDWDTRAWRHSLDALDAPESDEDDDDQDDDRRGRDDRDDDDPDDGPGGGGGGRAASDPVEGDGDAEGGGPLLARNGKSSSSRSPRGPWQDASDSDAHGSGVFVEELADEPDEPFPAEEVEAWFRPGRPGQTEAEREAEQLSTFELEPPPAAPPEAYGARLLGREARARDPTLEAAAAPVPTSTTHDVGQIEGLGRELAGALPAELQAERERLERRVRDAERALESEVWRGLATHRELVTTRQKLDELEAKLVEPAATLGGFEPISAIRPDAPQVLEAAHGSVEPAPLVTDDRAAVLTLDVEDRDSWVHWLLLENDPFFLGSRARTARQCADAVRTRAERPSRDLAGESDRSEELLHWLEAESDGPTDAA